MTIYNYDSMLIHNSDNKLYFDDHDNKIGMMVTMITTYLVRIEHPISDEQYAIEQVQRGSQAVVLALVRES